MITDICLPRKIDKSGFTFEVLRALEKELAKSCKPKWGIDIFEIQQANKSNHRSFLRNQ